MKWHKSLQLVCMLIVMAAVVALVGGCTSHQIGPSSDNSLLKKQSTYVSILPSDNVTYISGLAPDWGLNDLVEVSDVVLVGEVVKILPSQYSLDVNGKKTIYTDVIVKPSNHLFGQVKSGNVAVRLDGGRISNNVVKTDQEPVLILGEKVVLFLFNPTSYNLAPFNPVPEGIEPSNYFDISGGALGKWILNGNEAVDFQGNKHTITEISQAASVLHSR